jgi:hypothetical protein
MGLSFDLKCRLSDATVDLMPVPALAGGLPFFAFPKKSSQKKRPPNAACFLCSKNLFKEGVQEAQRECSGVRRPPDSRRAGRFDGVVARAEAESKCKAIRHGVKSFGQP